MYYLGYDLDFDFDDLEKEMEKKNMTPEDLGDAYGEIGEYAAYSRAQKNEQSKSENHSERIGRHTYDIFDVILYQLIKWLWWILEIIPTLTTYQDLNGKWIHLRM